MMAKRFHRLMVLAALLGVFAVSAQAQTWPDKPIRLVEIGRAHV